MPLFLIAWLVLFVVYLCMLVFAAIRWRTISGKKPAVGEHAISISVIIPVRNESANITRLLQDLAEQTYPTDLYEVIVVDDHSDDDTFGLVTSFIGTTGRKFRVVSASESPFAISSPKKNALAYGISLSKGSHIITTDGDCRVGPAWLATHAGYLAGREVKMVTGPVFYSEENSFLARAQGLELAALIGAGAVSLSAGKAGMANGANLSFSVDVYHEVGGYAGNEHVVSGDDEFLLRKIHRQFPESVVFAKNKEAIVTTGPCPDLATLFHQRRRWAGKWRLHRDFFSLLLPTFIFLFYLGWIASWGALILDFRFIWLILSTFILKTATEFLFLHPVRIFGGKRVSLPVLIALQLAYPFYTIFFGIAANTGGYEWKGRIYSKHTND